MQAYSDPRRESDPYSLPDVEVWDSHYVECPECGNTVLYNNARSAACPECSRVFAVSGSDPVGWFWWTCLPGCLPDSDVNGPYDTRELALADAQEDADLDEEDGEDEMERDRR